MNNELILKYDQICQDIGLCEAMLKESQKQKEDILKQLNLNSHKNNDNDKRHVVNRIFPVNRAWRVDFSEYILQNTQRSSYTVKEFAEKFKATIDATKARFKYLEHEGLGQFNGLVFIPNHVKIREYLHQKGKIND